MLDSFFYLSYVLREQNLTKGVQYVQKKLSLHVHSFNPANSIYFPVSDPGNKGLQS